MAASAVRNLAFFAKRHSGPFSSVHAIACQQSRHGTKTVHPPHKENIMIEEIADKISSASDSKSKSAMFHFQVLVHAHQLAHVDATRFCISVGMEPSYATEFRKMLKLAKVMAHEGAQLTLEERV